MYSDTDEPQANHVAKRFQNSTRKFRFKGLSQGSTKIQFQPKEIIAGVRCTANSNGWPLNVPLVNKRGNCVDVKQTTIITSGATPKALRVELLRVDESKSISMGLTITSCCRLRGFGQFLSAAVALRWLPCRCVSKAIDSQAGSSWILKPSFKLALV